MSTYAEISSPLRATATEVIALPFSFAPAGAGAPTLVTGRSISNVTRTGAGQFNIILKNKWAKYNGVYVSLGMSAATDLTVQELLAANTVTTSAATPTVQIVFQTAAVPTDIAANAANIVRGFVLVSRHKGKY